MKFSWLHSIVSLSKQIIFNRYCMNSRFSLPKPLLLYETIQIFLSDWEAFKLGELASAVPQKCFPRIGSLIFCSVPYCHYWLFSLLWALPPSAERWNPLAGTAPWLLQSCSCFAPASPATPYTYTKWYTFITSHWKHPKFAWGALKIYMAKWTLIKYFPSSSCCSSLFPPFCFELSYQDLGLPW